jgi:hypothetical protein
LGANLAKSIEVIVEYSDRKSGPGTVGGKARVEAGGLAAGVARGVREILGKQMDRKQRFDAVKSGIVIKATVLGESEAAAGGEAKSEA